MRAILTAPVDLLYFGGIGTYVKASSESHADAGDRANDAVARRRATQLRARVIGEGANLGFTQRGRVEAALAGRKINTDALDNSAGVDTSDHEVNIKIATGDAIATARCRRRSRRAAVLDDRRGRGAGAAPQLPAEPGDQRRRGAGRPRSTTAWSASCARWSARAGSIAPSSSCPTPTRCARAPSNRQPLTRPELSVLLAYAKIDLNEEILASDLPDDPLLEAELLRYFPAALRRAVSSGAIRGHRLRREITALQVVNSLVNRCGPTFVHTSRERTGATARRHRPRLHRRARRLEAARPVGRYRGARSRAQGRGADRACWSPRSASCRAACNGPCAACRSRSTRRRRRTSSVAPSPNWATCPRIWSARPRVPPWANARPLSKQWAHRRISHAAPPRSRRCRLPAT